MGMRPAPGRPTLPRARPRLTIAATLSAPRSCCVMPMDQTSTAAFAEAYSRANRSMSARVAPDCRSSSSNDSRANSATSVSNPSVCSRTKSRSTVPSASITLSTPLRNARSPPVCTAKNSSVMCVPNIALSTLLGTQ